MKTDNTSPPEAPDHYTTLEVAKLLGMAVRSVQLMVDRQELDAWKTPGGHRRISRASVERWQQGRTPQAMAQAASPAVPAALAQAVPAVARAAAHAAPGVPGAPGDPGAPRILLIEDSVHFQNLVSLLVRRHLPAAELQMASDGITGLALYGQMQPDLLIVDILLPGVDGATLITTLRSHPQFARSRLIVVTSLDAAQRAPYAFALEGVTVIHKPQLVAELPVRLAEALAGGVPA